MALAEMSEQLAPVAQAPPAVVRRLANHDEITVAGPVLKESARLREDDLIEIAKTKSEQHLLAISGRWWLKEVVTDALLARHYPGGQPQDRQQSRRTSFRRRVRHCRGAGGNRSRAGRRSRHPGRFAFGTSRSTPARCDGRGADAAVVARTASPFRANPRLRSRPRPRERRSRNVQVRDFTAARRHVAELAKRASSTRQAVRLRQAEAIRGDRRCIGAVVEIHHRGRSAP